MSDSENDAHTSPQKSVDAEVAAPHTHGDAHSGTSDAQAATRATEHGPVEGSSSDVTANETTLSDTNTATAGSSETKADATTGEGVAEASADVADGEDGSEVNADVADGEDGSEANASVEDVDTSVGVSNDKEEKKAPAPEPEPEPEPLVLDDGEEMVIDDGFVAKRVQTAITDDEAKCPPPLSRVYLHLEGKYNGEPFLSSLEEEVDFVLGHAEQCKGLEVAVSTMKVGEEARVRIASASSYNYSKYRMPEKLKKILEEAKKEGKPPGELEFFARVLRYRQEPSVHELDRDGILENATALNELGNEQFRHGRPISALRSYEKAGTLLLSMDKDNLDSASRFGVNPMMNMMNMMGNGMPPPGMPGQEPPEEKQLDPVLKPELIRAQLNSAACLLRLKHPTEAKIMCKEVLKLDSKNPKALYRLGVARKSTEPDDAYTDLRNAKRIIKAFLSNNKEVLQASPPTSGEPDDKGANDIRAQGVAYRKLLQNIEREMKAIEPAVRAQQEKLSSKYSKLFGAEASRRGSADSAKSKLPSAKARVSLYPDKPLVSDDIGDLKAPGSWVDNLVDEVAKYLDPSAWYKWIVGLCKKEKQQ